MLGHRIENQFVNSFSVRHLRKHSNTTGVVFSVLRRVGVMGRAKVGDKKSHNVCNT